MTSPPEGRYSNATKNPLLPLMYAALRCFCEDHWGVFAKIVQAQFPIGISPSDFPITWP